MWKEGKDKVEMGRIAEGIASDFLVKVMGHRLLARNWRTSHLEVDVVTEDERFLHIVEVRSLEYVEGRKPYETIGHLKRRRLISAAARFALENRVHKEIVFDVVSVEFDRGCVKSFLYLPDAFAPCCL